jgi:hypothetical protein
VALGGLQLNLLTHIFSVDLLPMILSPWSPCCTPGFVCSVSCFAWDSALACEALGVTAFDSSCPLTWLVAHLLAYGLHSSTKQSYTSKWQHFVHFCTVTLPELYVQCPRRFLPASQHTVLLSMEHLINGGLVSESSLNPYKAAINQAQEDLGLAHPALGHSFRLARAGWCELEGVERDTKGSCSTRMSVPTEVMFDILQMGLATNDTHTLHRCTCLVLCYCWYNHTDSDVLLLRSHVTFNSRGITVYTQGKTLPRNVACPIH